MHPNSARRCAGLLSAIVLLLVQGCATAPPPQGVELRTTDDLAELRDQAIEAGRRQGNERVLVAFDLDNTLLAMETELGADQWYDWQRSLQQADRCDPRLVPDRLAVQGALFHLGSMRPAQPNAVAVVEDLQARGFTTMVLTARGQDFRLATFRELRRNGLSFRDSAPGPEGGFEESWVPASGSRPVRYEDGAYLLAGQHKGDMLIELIERLGIEPPREVIFADDKRKNVSAVAEALEREGIAGTLFLYTREAERVEAFNGERAEADWRTLAPALLTVQAIMGEANYALPEDQRPEGCP